MRPLAEAFPPRRPDVPKDQYFICYVCGAEAYTYRTIRTVPPNPHIIHPPVNPSTSLSTVIIPVATCGSAYCEKAEMMRQDAIFNVLVQPIRERYLQEKEARINRARANARNRSTSEEE